MAYCTVSDITNRYSHRTKLLAQITGDPNGVSVDTTKLQEAIDATTLEMNVSLQVAYDDLSELASNEYLKNLAIEFAVLWLEKQTPSGLNEAEQKAYDEVQKKLEKISTGSIRLITPVVDDAEDNTFFRSEPRVFNRGDMI